jgi:hypothetical protein
MVFHGNLDSGFQDLSILLNTTPSSLEGPGALHYLHDLLKLKVQLGLQLGFLFISIK